jgi:predicted RecB family nuclease
MTTRFDISSVPLQGGYVAKQCPVRAQNDVIVPVEPLPPTPFQERLFKAGRDFEAELFSELAALHSDAVLITEHGADAEAATLRAMQRRTPLILAGRLPSDDAGRRVGKPDILIAAGSGGYRAVDVKHHMAVQPEPPTRQGMPAIISPLVAPTRETAAVEVASSARKNEDDLLQLAHYQRMLEAIGMHANDGSWGGIVGTERAVVWYDLDARVWRSPALSQQSKLRSTMERYDFEFAFRLDVIAVAEQHKRDASVALLVVPVKIPECGGCPWWDYCRLELERPPGDVSLLPRIGWAQWKVHRDHGVTNRAALAALDPLTARLVAGGIDVVAVRSATDGLDPDVDLADVAALDFRPKDLKLLASDGITSIGDVRQLCARTASYSDISLRALPTHVDLARAALGPEPVSRRRDVNHVTLPRADIEVDIDMENIEEGCYLWGCYVTDHSGRKVVQSGYQPFVTWAPMTPEVEKENSGAFWVWLMGLRNTAHESGLTFAAYCYNASAENQYLRRLGQLAGIEDEVERFIESEEWVDLLAIWNSQLITGGSSALKVVAPLVGFSWDMEDPGGGESMLRYDAAVGDGDDVAVARKWLLAYNRGDVEATLALREWLEVEGAEVPPVESLVF